MLSPATNLEDGRETDGDVTELTTLNVSISPG
jgi:hypothetical protein